jgi:hypothetical protein
VEREGDEPGDHGRLHRARVVAQASVNVRMGVSPVECSQLETRGAGVPPPLPSER